ncbi:MAG: ABC transporter substrate-binding protein [Limnochordia bacterium]
MSRGLAASRWVGVVTVLLSVAACIGVGFTAPVKVQMIEFARVDEAEWQRAVAERFNASQKDISIELISLAGSTVHTKPLTMIAAGAPPDISYNDPYRIIEWTHQGLVQDLTPYLARDRKAFAEFFDPLLDLYTVKGGKFGIPIDLQVQGFFYREDFFDEAGVAYPREGMTWDDIARISPRLVVQNNEGVISRYAIRFPQFWHWWSIFWHYGASFFDNEWDPQRFVGDSTQMREGLEYLRSMIHDKRVMSPRTMSGATAVNLVVNGQVAMAIGNSLYMQEMVRLGHERPWNVTRLPYGPAGNNMAWFNSLGWFIISTADHPQEAWEVIKYFSSEASMRLSVEMRGTLVPHRRVSQTVWMQQWEYPKDRRVFLDAIGTARGLPAVFGEGINAIVAGVNAVVDGQKPIPQVIADWQVQLNTWLKDRR